MEECSIQELIDKIKSLEEQLSLSQKELSLFKKDGLEGSLHALNYQLNKLNEVIINADISLSADDKQFERFWKIVTEIEKVHASISNLKKMINGGGIIKTEATLSPSTIMEDLAKTTTK